jgi:hypothetical protein
MLQTGEGSRLGRRLNSTRIFRVGRGRLCTDGPYLRYWQPLNYHNDTISMGIGTRTGAGLSLWELAMPDLDLIKQGEQGVRDRRGRFARGCAAGWPRGCRDHVREHAVEFTMPPIGNAADLAGAMARAGFDQIDRHFGVIASEAKQSGAVEPSAGRDCFVARCAPRNDAIEI